MLGPRNEKVNRTEFDWNQNRYGAALDQADKGVPPRARRNLIVTTSKVCVPVERVVPDAMDRDQAKRHRSDMEMAESVVGSLPSKANGSKSYPNVRFYLHGFSRACCQESKPTLLRGLHEALAELL